MSVEEFSNKPSVIIKDNILIGPKYKFNRTECNIGKNILSTLKKYPEFIGQIDADTGKRTNFAEMNDRSVRCALWLKKQKLVAQDVITICTHNHIDAYIPCLATFYVGAIYNSWHHEITAPTARHLIKLVKPKIMFICKSAVDLIAQVAKEEGIDTKFVVYEVHPGFDCLQDLLNEPESSEIRNFEAVDINPDDICLLTLSSGTTGLSKGVPYTYEGFNEVREIFFRAEGNNLVGLWYSSLHWLTATFFMLNSLLDRSTRILHSDTDPDEICKVIEKYKVNWFYLGPALTPAMLVSGALKRYNISSLKLVFIGGSKISRGTMEEIIESIPHAFVYQGYGMIETGGPATIQTRNRDRVDSVGVNCRNVDIKIIDIESGKSLGPNQEGEICVRTNRAMKGYYNDPETTKTTLIDGWIHSGDLGHYSEKGELFITGRIKDVMKFRGYHVSATEIEELLSTHPEVMEVAVVAMPHSMDLEHPMAFVKKLPGAKVTEEDLVKLSSTLGDHKKLRGGVKFIENMPYSASGKIKKGELREMAKAYAI